MRNSSEIADYLAQILKERKIKPIDFAKRVNVDRSTISRYLNKTRKISMDDLPKIAEGLGMSPVDFLLKDEDLANKENIYPISNEMVEVPILGRIACGDPLFVEENISEYKTEPADDLPSGQLFYLRATGDSMSPTIPNESLVLIRYQNDVESGEIAAVLLNGDEEATLKRVKKQDGMVILLPDNNAYDPMFVTKDNPAKIIGKALEIRTLL